MIRAFKLALILFLVLITGACSQNTDTSKNGSNSSSGTKQGRGEISLAPKNNYQIYNVGSRNVKVMQNDGDHLWIGTSQGLFNYDKTTVKDFKSYTYDDVLLSNGIFSITLDNEGRKWIGTYGGGLSVFNGKKWDTYNVQNGLCDSFIYDVLFKDNGDMWVATWSGANRVRGDINKRSNWEKFTVHNTKNGSERGLGDDWVYAMDKDSKGNIWMGTELGITYFDDKTWGTWAHSEGMGASFDVVNDDNASMNAALKGDHHKGQQTQAGLLQRNVGNYNPNYVVSMKMDKKDQLWIGTWGGGLSMFDTISRKFTNYTVKEGLPGNYVIALDVDDNGNVWVGTNAGLSKFNGKKFENYTTKDGLFSNYVFSLEFDKEGLWAGGWGGLSHIFKFTH